MSVIITYNKSFYDKVNTAKYEKAIHDTLLETTEQTMIECQEECPVRTGNLLNSHYIDVEEFTSIIGNTAEYWMYVVYGTYKMAANNYPRRAINNIISKNIMQRIFIEKLIKEGII